ncbi:hypothetical protein HWV62_8461, partial [Athelia sp. TMB]
ADCAGSPPPSSASSAFSSPHLRPTDGDVPALVPSLHLDPHGHRYSHRYSTSSSSASSVAWSLLTDDEDPEVRIADGPGEFEHPPPATIGRKGLSYARRPSATDHRSTVPLLHHRTSSSSTSASGFGFARSAPAHTPEEEEGAYSDRDDPVPTTTNTNNSSSKEAQPREPPRLLLAPADGAHEESNLVPVPTGAGEGAGTRAGADAERVGGDAHARAAARSGRVELAQLAPLIQVEIPVTPAPRIPTSTRTNAGPHRLAQQRRAGLRLGAARAPPADRGAPEQLAAREDGWGGRRRAGKGKGGAGAGGQGEDGAARAGRAG